MKSKEEFKHMTRKEERSREPSKALSRPSFPPKPYRLKLKVMTPSLYDTSRLPFMSLAMSRAMESPMP